MLTSIDVKTSNSRLHLCPILGNLKNKKGFLVLWYSSNSVEFFLLFLVRFYFSLGNSSEIRLESKWNTTF